MQMHQLCVEIDGYERVTPITVDKVGVYFRSAIPKLQKVCIFYLYVTCSTKFSNFFLLETLI